MFIYKKLGSVILKSNFTVLVLNVQSFNRCVSSSVNTENCSEYHVTHRNDIFLKTVLEMLLVLRQNFNVICIP